MANALNAGIIMAGQPVDVVGAMDAGAIAGQRANQFRQQNALNAYLQQNGGAVMGGDQNALNALAGFGMDGLNAAQNVQTTRLGMDQTRLGMEATRQNMQLAQSQEARLTRQEERAIAEHAATLSREQRAQEAQQIEQAVAMGLAATSPEQWDAVVGQTAPNLVGQFDNREVIAGKYMSIADVLKRADDRNAPQTTGYIATGDTAAALGLPSDGAYNIESGPGGMKATAIGGGGVTVENNLGGGAEIGTIPPGYEAFIDPATGMRAMRQIPGGPVDTSVADSQTVAGLQDSLALIDSVIADPKLSSITGMVQGNLPPLTQSGTDLNVKLTQIKGQAFLSAFDQLKGAGAITETEGAAATAAMARLDRAQSTDAYKQALGELRTIMARGIARTGQKRGAADVTDDELLNQYLNGGN
ncbi:hypothetical protein [Loktanella sp. R86503]|uniref:hypothetical protein n=1 Tax=Loktanella sp. R86503 TaxID=3093847 RepID=UPI0036D849C7